VLAGVEETLKGSGTRSPETEARWIVETATKRARAELLLGSRISSREERRCHDLAARRAAGEPLQYVTGTAAFRHLQLAVGPNVFIPRPETELVAELAMQHLPRGGRLVDVGTGSGAIALAVADERPDAAVFATESSPQALAWAQRNLELLGTNVQLVLCDLLDGLPPEARRSFDVVVSNPPYIDPAQARSLSPEVSAHEPRGALFAGDQGLEVMTRLAEAAPRWLKRGGWLVLEIGSDQRAEVEALLRGAGLQEVTVRPDLTGRDRIAEARRP
jgi:release factor glutamine methyltransferase